MIFVSKHHQQIHNSENAEDVALEGNGLSLPLVGSYR